MINNNYIYTDHALERFNERFPLEDRDKALKKITYCNKIEVEHIKQSKSYREIKKGKKENIYFYKNEKKAFFICEVKTQKRNDNKVKELANVIITVFKEDELDKEEMKTFYTRMAESERKLLDYEEKQRNKIEKATLKGHYSIINNGCNDEELIQKSLKALNLFYKKNKYTKIKIKKEQIIDIKNCYTIFTLIKLGDKLNGFRSYFISNIDDKKKYKDLNNELYQIISMVVSTKIDFNLELFKPALDYYNEKIYELINLIIALYKKTNDFTDLNRQQLSALRNLTEKSIELKISDVLEELMIDLYAYLEIKYKENIDLKDITNKKISKILKCLKSINNKKETKKINILIEEYFIMKCDLIEMQNINI